MKLHPQEPKKEPNQYQYYGVDWGEKDEKTYKSYKKNYVVRNRDCTSCNTTKLTTDEDVPYICADCKWRQYHKEKGETSE